MSNTRSSMMNRVSTDLQLENSFELRKNLVTEQEQIIWESIGLSRDAQVTENAALVRQMINIPFGSCPTPLVIDPTQTAFVWLEEFLRSEDRAFEVTSQNNERLTYSLELAVRFGKILVVNECEDLRPPLIQLVAARIFARFNKKQLQVGNKLVDLHEKFQVVLFTKTNKLTIEPETLSYLTCIPFTITAVGLTDQLMSKAIVLKNPALEQKRIDLLKNEGVLLKQRIELEDKLLEELSAAQGDILKNDKLLHTLNEVKESSSFIDRSLKESTLVKETLLAEYTQLRELCAKGATFYMGLCSMYEIAALVFIQLCLRSLETAELRNVESVHSIYIELVRSTFQYLARSTPRGSHLTLAMFICKNAFPDYIKSGEWELFVTNFMSSSDTSVSSLSGNQFNFPEWINKDAAIKLQILLTHTPELQDQLQLNKDYLWRNFIADHATEFPGQIRSHFHRVLIAQIFRPDLIATELRLTAAEILGISPDSILQPTVEQLVDESTSEQPILVITQAENDPATEIKSVAMKRVGKEAFVELSVGKGMEHKALEVIKKAAAMGQWICIKNVHLVSAWLVTLDRELGTIKKMDGFRLWLLCESTQGFSEAVMYKFVKVLYEYPAGIKNKVRRMTQNFAAADLRSQLNDAKLVKIRVVLFIANAVLQERRKFIPQGWSKYYEFGDADLKAAQDILFWLDSMMVSGRCDWKILQRLCENVAFGGRISNSKDLQVLQRYLEEFFNSEVLSNRWTPLNMKVTVPTTTNIQDYFTVIAKFPDVDEPASFKLSKHSNLSREIEFSKTVIKELRASYYQSEQSRDNESKIGLNQNISKVEKQIKPILSFWRKLAGKSTILQTAKNLQESTLATNPWAVFVISELKIGGNCFREVHSTLSQVHTWLKESHGNAKTTIDKDIFTNLVNNQVVPSWQQLWAGPETAVDYIKALVNRANFAEKRFQQQLELEFVDEIDLATVFNSESFLSALKLVNASKLCKSAKNLQLTSTVIGAQSEQHRRNASSAVAVKLQPLKVDGAVFDYGKLIISNQADGRGQMDKSPEFQITFMEQTTDEERTSNGRLSSEKISLPVYSNTGREQLICHLDVASSESMETVLLSGAALLIADY